MLASGLSAHPKDARDLAPTNHYFFTDDEKSVGSFPQVSLFSLLCVTALVFLCEIQAS
jgi:hypothetical protein